MEGLPNLPPHLQGEFMKQMENMQMKDSLRWVLESTSFVLLYDVIERQPSLREQILICGSISISSN